MTTTITETLYYFNWKYDARRQLDDQPLFSSSVSADLLQACLLTDGDVCIHSRFGIRVEPRRPIIYNRFHDVVIIRKTRKVARSLTQEMKGVHKWAAKVRVLIIQIEKEDHNHLPVL